MSVFQVKDWWSTKVSEGEEFDVGCMMIGNIDNAPDRSNKIILASQSGALRIYLPARSGYRGIETEIYSDSN